MSAMVAECQCGAEVDGAEQLGCAECGRDYIDIVLGDDE